MAKRFEPGDKVWVLHLDTYIYPAKIVRVVQVIDDYDVKYELDIIDKSFKEKQLMQIWRHNLYKRPEEKQYLLRHLSFKIEDVQNSINKINKEEITCHSNSSKSEQCSL
jgi:hypothetical protein